MTNFIPIFPLGIVVFPGETLNLHIFEPRYKQLVQESFVSKKHFGIPVVIDNTVNEIGTLVKITEITNTYEDGKMDIRAEGAKIFRILETIKNVPDKLYSGAIVNYPENSDKINPLLLQQVLLGIKELHAKLNINKELIKSPEELTSYDLAHHAGLSLEQEYELLGLFHEMQRLEYLKRHLQKVLPVVTQMESLKEKIKLNGHFKNLEGYNL